MHVLNTNTQSPVRSAPDTTSPQQARRSSSRSTTTGMITAVTLALAVTLTGCSSGSDAAPSPGTGTENNGVTPQKFDPNAGLKNGSELKTALITKKDIPAGFKVQPDLTRDSAEGFGPKGKNATPTKASCKHLNTNVWINGAGIDSAAFAQTSFKNSDGLEIDAEIDAYHDTDAAKVMDNLDKLFKVCAAYKTVTPGAGKSTVKVTHKPGPKAGDASTKAVLTSPVWQDGSTLIAVQVDTSVITVLYSSTKAAAAKNAAKYAETMAKRLAEKA
jgi:hypothetical protein